MVTGIEHRYALVNGVLDDFVGLAGFARGFLAVARDQDGVDDVNDAVRGLDVGLDHLGLIDQERVARWLDGEFGAIYGFRRIKLGGFLGLNFAGNGVVGQDAYELLFVFRFEK